MNRAVLLVVVAAIAGCGSSAPSDDQVEALGRAADDLVAGCLGGDPGRIDQGVDGFADVYGDVDSDAEVTPPGEKRPLTVREMRDTLIDALGEQCPAVTDRLLDRTGG